MSTSILDLDCEGYKLWRVDTQDRPCCGTTETDTKRRIREDLPPNGFRSRLSTIFTDFAASGAHNPTTKAFAWYNMTSQRSQAFHIKLAMEPAVYHQVYLKHYGISIEQSLQSAQRFKDDYYGDRVLMVYQAAQVGQAVPAGNADSQMLRANDQDVLKTGAVLLFKTKPLLLEELTDEIMTTAETAVLDAFRLHYNHPKPFWHSICLQPLLTDASSSAPLRFLIGCKMDENIFKMALSTSELQETFDAAFIYRAPKREYRDIQPPKKHDNHLLNPKHSVLEKYNPGVVQPRAWASKKQHQDVPK